MIIHLLTVKLIDWFVDDDISFQLLWYDYNFQECEESPDAVNPDIAELMAKCKAGLIDYQANVNTINFDKFATDMKNEQEFLNGLQKQLVPWMDTAEVTANKSLQKPGNFDDVSTEYLYKEFNTGFLKIDKLLHH